VRAGLCPRGGETAIDDFSASSVFDALDFDIYTVTDLASITGTGG
jgi:hypothetical protein